MIDKLQIKYTPLNDFKRWNRNPKEHDIGTLHQSILRFGFNDPVCVNLRTGTIIEGHGRIDTLQQWKVRGNPPPERIEAKNGEWFVPTFFVDMDEREAEAYALAHNRITEVGGWDDTELAEVLSDLVVDDLLEGIGFDTDDLDELLKSIGQADPPPDPGAQMDKAEELQKVWQCERGQVWEVPSLSVDGKTHRVMCGDSTNEEDVGRLMEGEKAAMCFTDPPYGVAYSGRGQSTSQQTMENDDLSADELRTFLFSAFTCCNTVMRDGCVIYVCHADRPHGTRPAFELAFCDVGWKFSATIIWVKQVASMGWQDYRAQHEPLLYGWKKGDHYFCGDRALTTIWNVARDAASNYKHPTQKPVELVVQACKNSTQADEIVLDLFLGSGTTLVAAEQTGRIGYGMEIEPKYVAVSLQRLADMGLEPKLVE